MPQDGSRNIMIIAGKMAVSVQVTQAGGLGKTDDGSSSTVNSITLDEIGSPYYILSPPGLVSNTGTLYTQLAADQKIDFVISGIELQSSLIYLAMSKGANKAELWPPMDTGQLELDPDSLELISALDYIPSINFNIETPETSLGQVKRQNDKVTIPYQLSNLQSLGEEGETIYFQVVVIPIGSEGEMIWDESHASEVDAFVIDRTVTANPDYISATVNTCNSKSGDSGCNLSDIGIGTISSSASIFGKGE